MPTSILSWISDIYSTVKVNGVASNSFAISNGTRQGCPLSPLLFILSLEPLLEHIWLNPDIRGLETSTYHHKIAGYADDLLFNILEPHISLPVLLSIHANTVTCQTLKSICKSWKRSTSLLLLALSLALVATFPSTGLLKLSNIYALISPPTFTSSTNSASSPSWTFFLQT